MTVLESVLLEHGLSWLDGKHVGSAAWTTRCGSTGRSAPTSWLLYTQESPVAAGARGLARGELFTADGELVVSVVQEGLIRTASPNWTIAVRKHLCRRQPQDQIARPKRRCRLSGALRRLSSCQAVKRCCPERRCPECEPYLTGQGRDASLRAVPRGCLHRAAGAAVSASVPPSRCSPRRPSRPSPARVRGRARTPGSSATPPRRRRDDPRPAAAVHPELRHQDPYRRRWRWC